jgi:hypothetical protein
VARCQSPPYSAATPRCQPTPPASGVRHRRQNLPVRGVRHRLRNFAVAGVRHRLTPPLRLGVSRHRPLQVSDTALETPPLQGVRHRPETLPLQGVRHRSVKTCPCVMSAAAVPDTAVCRRAPTPCLTPPVRCRAACPSSLLIPLCSLLPATCYLLNVAFNCFFPLRKIPSSYRI